MRHQTVELEQHTLGRGVMAPPQLEATLLTFTKNLAFMRFVLKYTIQQKNATRTFVKK